MLKLRDIELNQKSELDSFFSAENSRSADFCFGNVYMWDKRFLQSVAQCGDRLITLLSRQGERYFAFPVGTGDIRPAFETMAEFCKAEGIPFKLCGICDEHLELINTAYPETFEIKLDRDFSDYIYDIHKLADYPGKHLHAKRNFCNRFEAEHNWRFVQLCRDTIPDCIKMLDEWIELSADRLSPDYVYEHDAILRGFESFEYLGLFGGVLYADDKIAGFSLGERISTDTFCIHFEKAFPDIAGAYPMVSREMSRLIIEKLPDICYVNREDDMGSDALRKSKLSYKPEYILTKYTAVYK